MNAKTHIESSVARIRAFARARGYSLNGLAEFAGLSESTIRHLYAEDWNPTRNTLRKLEAVVSTDFEPCVTPSSKSEAQP